MTRGIGIVQRNVQIFEEANFLLQWDQEHARARSRATFIWCWWAQRNSLGFDDSRHFSSQAGLPEKQSATDAYKQVSLNIQLRLPAISTNLPKRSGSWCWANECRPNWRHVKLACSAISRHRGADQPQISGDDYDVQAKFYSVLMSGFCSITRSDLDEMPRHVPDPGMIPSRESTTGNCRSLQLHPRFLTHTEETPSVLERNGHTYEHQLSSPSKWGTQNL